MPWWANLYITALSLMALGGFIEERKLGFSWFHVGLSFIATLILVVSFVGFFNASVPTTFGKALLPAIVLSILWGIYAGIKDMNQMFPFDDLSEAENRVIKKITVIFSIAIGLPGYIVGVIVGVRAW